jgi:cell division septation protein DedD
MPNPSSHAFTFANPRVNASHSARVIWKLVHPCRVMCARALPHDASWVSDPDDPRPGPDEDITRISRSDRPEPGAPQAGRAPNGDGGGRGWKLATVTIVALVLGIGAGYLINGGDDPKTKTAVHTQVRTVTSSPPEAQTQTSATVTHEIRTVERTVTVTVPAAESTPDTEPTQPQTSSTPGG